MRISFRQSGVLLIAIFCCCNMLFAQKEHPDCKDLHTGIFYFYPKNTADAYIDVRDDEYVHESNIATGDSSLWKIKWINDCTYVLSLVDVSGTNADKTKALMKKHVLLFKIRSVTNEYYVFEGYIDKATNAPIQADTMWLNEKTVVANNELFKFVPDSLLSATTPISDTCKYALLYVYRPGKVLLSLSDIPLYFDNVIMCLMHNNSGFVFKILKEGQFELKTRQFKAENAIQIDVHFGNVYYVKTALDWGIHKYLYNFKLDNILMNTMEGSADFQSLKYR